MKPNFQLPRNISLTQITDIALIKNNAKVAAQIAVELSRLNRHNTNLLELEQQSTDLFAHKTQSHKCSGKSTNQQCADNNVPVSKK